MERLTEWTGERWIATQSNRKLGDKDIYEKLAEYEDLRMTPSEIKSFLKDFGISLAMEDETMFRITKDGKLELYKEPYATIECKTEDDYNHIVKAIESMKDRREEPELTSHSEKHIVENCIALMESVYQNIIDFMGLEDEDEAPQLSYTYFEIVQTLLLWRTSHGGGTSTREKCEKLGFDSYGTVTIGEI